MPGHVKLGKSGEPDPDPLPYLLASMEMKRADMLKAYDAKKSYWCPDDKGGFIESLLESDDGTKATVMCGHEVSLRLEFDLTYFIDSLIQRIPHQLALVMKK